MSSITLRRTAIALSAIVMGFGTSASAGPASPANAAAAGPQSDSALQQVRHGRWGGVGIYIDPGYGYDYGYYRPRYRSYYDDGYYSYGDYGYRPYRHHSRRWARERFEHPLGRR